MNNIQNLQLVSEYSTICRLKDIAKVKGGKRMPKGKDFADHETPFPYIRVMDFKKNSVDLSNLKYVLPEDEVKIRNYKISKNDIYISIAGSIGIAGWIPDQLDNAQLTENAAKITNFNPNTLNIKYFVYLLNSDFVQRQIYREIGTGGGVPKLALHRIENLKIVLMDIKKQQKIASILENVDNNIDKTQKIIEKYEMMKQGLMYDLFTKGIDENGKPHTEFKDSELGEIPEDWNVKFLKDLIEIEHGYAFKGEYFTDKQTDYILLTPGNFHVKGDLYFNQGNTKYYSGDFPSKYILKNGDLLTVMTDLTKEMAILGNTVILDSKFHILHNQRIGKVIIKDSKNIFDKYILTIMNSKYCKNEIKKTATGTTVRHTAPERIYNSLVPICSYKEQKRISKIVLSVEKMIQSELKYLYKLQKLKTGLMQDLLTGKVRVKT